MGLVFRCIFSLFTFAHAFVLNFLYKAGPGAPPPPHSRVLTHCCFYPQAAATCAISVLGSRCWSTKAGIDITHCSALLIGQLLEQQEWRSCFMWALLLVLHILTGKGWCHQPLGCTKPKLKEENDAFSWLLGFLICPFVLWQVLCWACAEAKALGGLTPRRQHSPAVYSADTLVFSQYLRSGWKT